MTKITLLETLLRKAITDSDFDGIGKTLTLLKRGLTVSERKRIISEAQKKTLKQAAGAVLKFGNTDVPAVFSEQLILKFAQEEDARTEDVFKLRPTRQSIEGVIAYFISVGNLEVAAEYANCIGRELTSKELLACVDGMITNNDFSETAPITAIVQQLGKKQLPRKQRALFVQKYKENYDYLLYNYYGGKKSELDPSWFKRFITLNIERDTPGHAIRLFATERLDKLEGMENSLKKLFAYVAEKGSFHRETKSDIAFFRSRMPKEIATLCFCELINNTDGTLPSFFIEKLGFTMDSIVFSAYLKILRRIKISTGRLQLHLDVIDNFYRKPTKKEQVVILNYISRSGDYETFFEYAEKYSFEPTSYMIKTLQERNS